MLLASPESGRSGRLSAVASMRNRVHDCMVRARPIGGGEEQIVDAEQRARRRGLAHQPGHRSLARRCVDALLPDRASRRMYTEVDRCVLLEERAAQGHMVMVWADCAKIWTDPRTPSRPEVELRDDHVSRRSLRSNCQVLVHSCVLTASAARRSTCRNRGQLVHRGVTDALDVAVEIGESKALRRLGPIAAHRRAPTWSAPCGAGCGDR